MRYIEGEMRHEGDREMDGMTDQMRAHPVEISAHAHPPATSKKANGSVRRYDTLETS